MAAKVVTLTLLKTILTNLTTNLTNLTTSITNSRTFQSKLAQSKIEVISSTKLSLSYCIREPRYEDTKTYSKTSHNIAAWQLKSPS